MAIGMGEPTTNRGTVIVPRARLETHLQTEEIGPTTKHKTRNTWMVDSRLGLGTVTLLRTIKDFPMKKKRIGDALVGTTVHYYIIFNAQTQEPTEPFYGPKKPNGLYLQRKY